MYNNFLFISMPGPGEWVLILVAVLILFGGRKIPQLAKDLGSGIREFRKSLSGSASSEEIEDQGEKDLRTPKNKKSTKKTKS